MEAKDAILFAIFTVSVVLLLLIVVVGIYRMLAGYFRLYRAPEPLNEAFLYLPYEPGRYEGAPVKKYQTDAITYGWKSSVPVGIPHLKARYINGVLIEYFFVGAS